MSSGEPIFQRLCCRRVVPCVRSVPLRRSCLLQRHIERAAESLYEGDRGRPRRWWSGLPGATVLSCSNRCGEGQRCAYALNSPCAAKCSPLPPRSASLASAASSKRAGGPTTRPPTNPQASRAREIRSYRRAPRVETTLAFQGERPRWNMTPKTVVRDRSLALPIGQSDYFERSRALGYRPIHLLVWDRYIAFGRTGYCVVGSRAFYFTHAWSQRRRGGLR